MVRSNPGPPFVREEEYLPLDGGNFFLFNERQRAFCFLCLLHAKQGANLFFNFKISFTVFAMQGLQVFKAPLATKAE